MTHGSTLLPAWLTLNQATRYAGCGRTSMYVAINAGHVEARLAFGRTLISRASIDAHLATCPRLRRSENAARG